MCTRLASANDKVCQLLAHGRSFSTGTPTSSTTKTGRDAIAEILLKVTLKHQKSKINEILIHEILLNSSIPLHLILPPHVRGVAKYSFLLMICWLLFVFSSFAWQLYCLLKYAYDFWLLDLYLHSFEY